MMTKSIALAGAAFLLATATAFATANAQQIETEIDDVRLRVQLARTHNLHLISPDHFDDANAKLLDADRLYKTGGGIADIRARLAEARQELDSAQQFQDIGAVILEGALSARDAALEANAPAFAPEAWMSAEDAIRSAGREIEDGDQNEARDEAAEAAQQFRTAELQAIEKEVLGRARDLREAAREADADETAGRTFARADSLLQRAEAQLQEDRYARGLATALARSAGYQYENAARIAGLIDAVAADRDSVVEALVLSYDGYLADVTTALGFTASFLEGPGPVAQQSVTAIQSLYEQRDGLQQELRSAQQQIGTLTGQVDSLHARLDLLADSLGAEFQREAERLTAEARIEQIRRQAAAAQLRQRRSRDASIERVRDLFQSAEADVVVRGNDVIIRLAGLNFPVGSSEIRPENFPLLTNVQEALRSFPRVDAITIAGHTDAQGNDEFNLRLSERRAEAVRDYLIANMGLAEDLVAFTGFGESQPLATNETAEGRAQNRRIDIIVSLPPIETQ